MDSVSGDIRSPLVPEMLQRGQHSSDLEEVDRWDKGDAMGIAHRRSSLIVNPDARKQNGPMRYLLGIIGGVCFGIGLNLLRASDDVVTVVTLPGGLFLRALQCAVIPMMFFNMIASVADIFGSGNASTMGKLAMGLYTLSTVLAAVQGIIMAVVFAYLLDSDKGNSDDDDGVEVTMICPEDLGTLTVLNDGSTVCAKDGMLTPLNVSSAYQDFYLRDEDSMLINSVVLKQSLIDQIQTTTFSLVPNNAVAAFAQPNIISVIVIGCCIGGAVVHLQTSPRAAKGVDSVLQFCKEMSDVTNVIIERIIILAPFCIGFLIANSLASAGNMIDLLQTVGIYVLSVMTGLFVHVFVTLPCMFYYFTGGENPYSWLGMIRQPIVVALSTASSAAALPVSIQCAIDTGLVKEQTAKTLLPLGASMNMYWHLKNDIYFLFFIFCYNFISRDGSAIGYPCAISFLAHAAKLQNKLSIATWINVGVASSLGSAGAAPVPNAGIIMLITVWETAIPGYNVPDAIAYIQAIDFFTDSFRTATNVCSDLFILRMIQCIIDKPLKRIG